MSHHKQNLVKKAK